MQPSTKKPASPPKIPPKDRELCEYLSRWNWGAFFLTFVWGIFNRVWWSLLMFLPVPFIQIIIPFVLGAKGNRSAWKKGNYSSLEDFKNVQKKWAWAGFIWGIVLICILIYSGYLGAINLAEKPSVKSLFAFIKEYRIGSDISKVGLGAAAIKKKTGKPPQTMTEVLNSEDPKVKEALGKIKTIPLDSKGEKARYCLGKKDSYFMVYWFETGENPGYAKWNIDTNEILPVTLDELSDLNCVQH